GLDIDYRAVPVEALAAGSARFDVVLALEIVEHVADLGAFCEAASAVLRPGGAFIAATLNRTAKAFLFAVLGAEYVLRWLPRGTHDWRKFVRPSELAAALRPKGLRLVEATGIAYDPLSKGWRETADLEVNYMIYAVKAGG